MPEVYVLARMGREVVAMAGGGLSKEVGGETVEDKRGGATEMAGNMLLQISEAGGLICA